MLKKIMGTSGARILNAVVSLIVLWIATNKLGAEAWGLAGLILLDVSLILLLVELLAGSALVYFTPRKTSGSLFLMALGWTALVLLFFSVIFYVLSFAPSIYHLLVPKGYTWHILWLVALNSMHGFNLNYLLGKGRIALFNTLFVTQFSVLLISFSALVWYFDLLDERAFVYALYLAYGFPMLLGLIIIFPGLEFDKKESIPKLAREVFTFGLMGQLASISHLINKRLSFYFIRLYAGLAPLGVYNSGVQLTEGLRLIGQSISLVQFSSLSNSNDPEYARRLSLQLLKFSVVLTLMALLVLILIPQSIFQLVFSQAFGDIKLVIVSLSPGVIALAANTIFSHFFSGTGRPKYNLYAAFTGLVVTIPSLLVLVPLYGFVGAGISTSLAYMAAVVYQWFVFRKLTSTRAWELLVSSHDLRVMLDALKRLRGRM